MKCARAAEKAHLEDELKKKKAAQAEETAEEKNKYPRVKTRGILYTKSLGIRSKFQGCGAGGGILAFSGAPRSDVINVVLCRQFYRNPTTVRQSVLLPQNGSSRAKYGFLCTRSPQTPTYAFAHLAPEKHYQYFS